LGSSLSLSSLGETGRTGSLFPHCATHDAMPSLFVCEWRSRGERERRGKYRMDYSCCWWRYVRGKAQHRSTVISCRGQSQHGTPQKKRKTRAWMATTPLLPLCTPLSLDHLTPTTLTRLRLSLRIVRAWHKPAIFKACLVWCPCIVVAKFSTWIGTCVTHETKHVTRNVAVLRFTAEAPDPDHEINE
jgi:hypothetical protein